MALCAAIFATEPLTQLGFAHGFLYIPILLICERYNSLRRMQTLSLIVVVLIIAGYFVSPPPPPGFSTTFVVLNRFGAMVALMVIVWLAASYRHKVAEQASSLADEQRKQDQFQALVESLPVQIWTATPTGEIDYVGQKLEQFAG